MTDPTPSPDRLRADIDAGRTRDKVAWPDPAAAPLGTDDEAGGSGPTAADVAAARRAEVDPTRPPEAAGPGSPAGGYATTRQLPAWMAAPTTLVAAGLVVAATVVALVVAGATG